MKRERKRVREIVCVWLRVRVCLCVWVSEREREREREREKEKKCQSNVCHGPMSAKVEPERDREIFGPSHFGSELPPDFSSFVVVKKTRFPEAPVRSPFTWDVTRLTKKFLNLWKTQRVNQAIDCLLSICEPEYKLNIHQVKVVQWELYNNLKKASNHFEPKKWSKYYPQVDFQQTELPSSGMEKLKVFERWNLTTVAVFVANLSRRCEEFRSPGHCGQTKWKK